MSSSQVLRARDILATNVNALMATRRGLGSNKAVTTAGGPTNGSIDRIRRATHACRIDELDSLAAVFGVTLCELLHTDVLEGHPPLSADARKLAEDFDRITDPGTRRTLGAMVQLLMQGTAPQAALAPDAGAAGAGGHAHAAVPHAAPMPVHARGR